MLDKILGKVADDKGVNAEKRRKNAETKRKLREKAEIQHKVLDSYRLQLRRDILENVKSLMIEDRSHKLFLVNWVGLMQAQRQASSLWRYHVKLATEYNMQYKYFFLARRIQRSFRRMMIRYCGKQRSMRLNYDPVDITKFYYYSKMVNMLSFFQGNPFAWKLYETRARGLLGRFL